MKIGFIGLGDMGSRMAKHLLPDHQLSVTTRTKDKANELLKLGAEWYDSPRLLPDDTEVVILMVPDNETCQEVLFGEDGLFSSDRSTIVLNMSTITPSTSRKLSDEVISKASNYVEAPVSGTLPHAENKTLVVLAAGPQEVFERVRPVLALMGRRTEYFGNVGTAASAKLIINGILAIQTATVAESLQLAKESGIDQTRFLDLVNDTALGSGVSKAKGKNMVDDSHGTLFRYRYIIKDLEYGKDQFNKVATPLLDTTLNIYREGLQTKPEISDLDFSAISRVYPLDN